MNILITGASGFVGKALTTFLAGKNMRVIGLTRNKATLVHSQCKAIESLTEIDNADEIDAIINLAGAPIDKRWSAKYKRTLINSRVNTTKALYELVKRLKHKPKTILSASAIGYYGNNNSAVELTEDSPFQAGFTHDLCAAWEQEALKLKEFGCNIAVLRLGVVLGNGGMLKKVLLPFKLGLGGVIGTGAQCFSWVHIDDVINAIWFLLNAQNLSTAYNLTAPNGVTNKQWTKALAKALNRPAFLPMPVFVVRLLFGEMGENLLLGGQNVVPAQLQKQGFQFKYAGLQSALNDIVVVKGL